MAVALFTAGLTACSSGAGGPPLGVAQAADDNGAGDDGHAKTGEHDFDRALPHTNGRTCATCHVASDHFALLPASVEARFQANPKDPLFNPLDADDPTAASPTYQHLRVRGLIRVTIPLADNLDLVDQGGNVVTNAARTITVLRGVPTVENTALTAPYDYDGRAATLQDQALGALQNHMAITKAPPQQTLDDLAAYQKTVFSSPGVEAVAEALADGTTPPDPDPPFAPGSPEAQGKALFQAACAACHGGPTGNHITNQAAHDELFPQLDQNGSAETVTLPDGTVVPVLSGTHQNDPFMNIGTSSITYLTQIPPELGGFPNPDGMVFPQYRLRFYTDGTRTQTIFDLPPAPPLNGPNFFPQLFSTDPGRAITSGDPYDFEAFDVPQLRGISHTAPYFHDGSAADLPTLLDIYSRFIIPLVPALGFPPVNPPEGPGLPPEAFSPDQKAQLVAYLMKI
jgi:cytochrome c peroxidase